MVQSLRLLPAAAQHQGQHHSQQQKELEHKFSSGCARNDVVKANNNGHRVQSDIYFVRLNRLQYQRNVKIKIVQQSTEFYKYT